jgi:hypothetical protein
VSLNGKDLGERPFPPGGGVMRIPAPKAVWEPGLNEVRFDFAYAEAPKDHSADNKDPRKLSASFRWLAVIER